MDDAVLLMTEAYTRSAISGVEFRSLSVGKHKDHDMLFIADASKHNSRLLIFSQCIDAKGTFIPLLNDVSTPPKITSFLFHFDFMFPTSIRSDHSSQTDPFPNSFLLPFSSFNASINLKEDYLNRNKRHFVEVVAELSQNPGLDHSYGVCHDSSGNVYVSNQHTDCVLRFEVDTWKPTPLVTPINLISLLLSPPPFSYPHLPPIPTSLLLPPSPSYPHLPPTPSPSYPHLPPTLISLLPPSPSYPHLPPTPISLLSPSPSYPQILPLPGTCVAIGREVELLRWYLRSIWLTGQSRQGGSETISHLSLILPLSYSCYPYLTPTNRNSLIPTLSYYHYPYLKYTTAASLHLPYVYLTYLTYL